MGLVGPGDTTKTTLLDAIGLALHWNYAVSISDSDFYECDIANAITIRVAVSELPEAIIQSKELGHLTCGINADGQLFPEPDDDLEACLLIQFSVDDSLEPIWEVIRPEREVSKRITTQQRQQLGFHRLDDQANVHLKWGRASGLTYINGNNKDPKTTVLSALRLARNSVFNTENGLLNDAATRAHEEGQALGSYHIGALRPGLDPRASSSGNMLVLHDGNVPMTSFGLGTRRLTALAIQALAHNSNSIIAIDEVEHGLEPHRLVHVIKTLKDKTNAGTGQVFLTSHSTTVIQFLTVEDIQIVRCTDGSTAIHPVSSIVNNVQGTVRSAPVALLSNRIVIGEGKTEIGLLNGLAEFWNVTRVTENEPTSSQMGIGFVDGNGDSMVEKALHFESLGYQVSLLIDNDKVVAGENKLNNCQVVRCSKGYCLEEQIINNLSKDDLSLLIKKTLEFRDFEDQPIIDRTNAMLENKIFCLDPNLWPNFAEARSALARVAAGKKAHSKDSETKKAWYKDETGGRFLAEFLTEKHYGQELMVFLSNIEQMIFSEPV